MTEPRPQRTIFCPLEIEAKGLKKHGVEDSITISGPGAQSVEKAVRDASGGPVHRHFILAGLAGGLHPRILSGEAFWINRILDRDANTLAVDESVNPENGSSASIHMANTPLFSPEDKRKLHDASKADLVDMEAWAFAQACDRLGIKWSIIRGVSDDSSENLPPGTDTLVDQSGSSRPLRIATYLLTRPWRIPALARLSGRTSRALKNVACELRKLS